MKKFLKILAVIFGVIALLCVLCTVANKINAAAINKYIDTFSPVEDTARLEPSLDEYGNYYFTTDGDFKVLHLTDVHLCGGFLYSGNDKKALNAVAAMVSAERPDLVVISGDISFAVPWTGTLNNEYAHSFAKRLMERLGVYWTVTFGNHDSEGYNFHNRAAVAEMYSDESMRYCLFSSDDGGAFGECNHVINVRNGDGIITQSLIMMDTNAYKEDDPLGISWNYDRIHDDQIEWYRGTVEKYSAYNESHYASLAEDKKVENAECLELKSLLFIHIPLMEVRDAYEEYVNNNRQNTANVTYLGGHDGESGKMVYCSEDEEEMFETILQLGSTKGLFYGHDHLNNFVLEYKGVTLSYGYSIDYSAYSGISKLGYQRGCAVIECKPDTSFTVTHENYYQEKYPALYEKESVDMSK